MRSLPLSALAAATIVAAGFVGLTSDASAATRHVRQRAPIAAPAAPIVRQDPYSSYNSYYDVPGPAGRRDVNPISGTPRWNASGGAA